MNHTHLIAAILIAALITVGLRAFPFVLMKAARRYEALFAFLGNAMPPGIMAILAIYAVTTLTWQGNAAWVSAGALLLLMVLEHRLRRPVISLCAALGVYVLGQSMIAGGIW